MAENSRIEWTKHTLNLWWGCTKVHEGCDNCYAEVWSNRWNNNLWGNDNPRREIKNWDKTLIKFNNKAKELNEIHNVFIGSMMDIFEKPMPIIDKDGNSLSYDTKFLRDKLFNEIVPETKNLKYLFLTKRPSNINKYIPESWKISPPDNVMFGTSVVNQKTADDLIPQLLKVKGKKFLSIEPQLDKISLENLNGKSSWKEKYQVLQTILYSGDSNRDAIDWVIVGGESGTKRRPYNSEWAYLLRDECKRNNVPFFMKQIDKVIPIPEDLQIREFPI